MTTDIPGTSASNRQANYISGSAALNTWSAIMIGAMVGIFLLWFTFKLGSNPRADLTAARVSFMAGGFILAVSLFWGYQTALTRLSLSVEGLEFRWGFGSLASAWKDVLSVEKRTIGSNRGVPSIVDALILSNQSRFINLSQYSSRHL